MFGSMGQTNVKNLGNGGTMDGDVTITGDLTVSGGIGLSLSEVIEGTSTIDVTNTEALLVRKNGDGGDVFKVDTQNTRVGIGSTFSPSYLLHLKSGDNVMASFESTDANASIYLVDSNTTADATFKRVTNDLILLESGGSVGIGMSPSASHALAVGGDVQLTDQHPAINFTDSDDNSDSRIYHSAGSLYIDADNNNEVGSSIIRFSVDDSEVMRMVGSSVGIGAGTDTAKPLAVVD